MKSGKLVISDSGSGELDSSSSHIKGKRSSHTHINIKTKISEKK